MNPWLGIASVLGAAGAMLASLYVVERRGILHAEVVRKAAHVGTGLLALTFPWLFDDAWPVLAVVGAVLAVLLAVRARPALKGGVGRMLHGVDRASFGELALPASVAILFVLADGDLVLYAVPLLIVTFADAVAAIVGVGYGRLRYDTAEGQKTAEGSIAFFVVAFFAAHVPLLLLTDTGRAETLLIALILGFLLVLFEGVAWAGLDNLLIPVSGFLLLERLLPLSVDALATRLAVVALLGLVALAWRRHTTLNASALFAVVLVGFLLWTLGDWRWLLAPFLVFAGYRLLPPRIDLDRVRIHDVRVVLSVVAAGAAWIVLARGVADPRTHLLGFTVAFAAHLAIIYLVRLHYARPSIAVPALLAAAVAAGTLLLAIAWLAVAGPSGPALLPLAWGALGVALATVLFHVTRRRPPTEYDPSRWARQAIAAAVGSLAALGPLAGGLA